MIIETILGFILGLVTFIGICILYDKLNNK